ncbi:thermopsin precursor, partial [mine drainage metagenome]
NTITVHNFQVPYSEFNFGSDTAETISNVVDSQSAYHDIYLGQDLPGTGTLGQVYDGSQMAILNITGSRLNGGTIFLNSSAYSPPYPVETFQGDGLNLTVIPYPYNLTVRSGSVAYTVQGTFQAGYHAIILGGGSPT